MIEVSGFNQEDVSQVTSLLVFHFNDSLRWLLWRRLQQLISVYLRLYVLLYQLLLWVYKRIVALVIPSIEELPTIERYHHVDWLFVSLVDSPQ